jgi:hypothetical protein
MPGGKRSWPGQYSGRSGNEGEVEVGVENLYGHGREISSSSSGSANGSSED